MHPLAGNELAVAIAITSHVLRRVKADNYVGVYLDVRDILTGEWANSKFIPKSEKEQIAHDLGHQF